MCKSDVKTRSWTRDCIGNYATKSVGEVSGIPSVAVKCVDIRRNTSGEGGLLDDH